MSIAPDKKRMAYLIAGFALLGLALGAVTHTLAPKEFTANSLIKLDATEAAALGALAKRGEILQAADAFARAGSLVYKESIPTPKALADILEIKTDTPSGLIEVVATHKLPKVALTSAEAISRALLLKSGGESASIDTLTEELQKLRERVGIAEAKLMAFQARYETISFKEERARLNKKMATLSPALTRLETSLIELAAFVSQIDAATNKVALAAISIIARDSRLKSITAKINAMEPKRIKLLQKLQPDHPDITAFDATREALVKERTELINTIALEVKSRYAHESASAEGLKKLLAKNSSERSELDMASVKMQQLKRDATRGGELLTKTEHRLTALKNDKNASRQMEKPTLPKTPSGPSRLKYIMIGLLVGLAVGVAVMKLLPKTETARN